MAQDLESRVQHLEGEMGELKHRLASRGDSTAMALSLIHDRLGHLDERVGDGFRAVDLRFDRVDERMGTLRTELQEVAGNVGALTAQVGLLAQAVQALVERER